MATVFVVRKNGEHMLLNADTITTVVPISEGKKCRISFNGNGSDGALTETVDHSLVDLLQRIKDASKK